jgi:hypothetical protein
MVSDSHLSFVTGFRHGTISHRSPRENREFSKLKYEKDGQEVLPESKTMKRLLAFVLILATFLGTAIVATRTVFAAPPQRGSSTLSGLVLGPNDKPVARAAITYQSSAGTAPHVVRTDARGRFSIPKLAADNYDLRASANGIFSEWEKNVSIRNGETRTITLRLLYAKRMPKPGSITAGNVK